jgi:S-adenosyl-L-methionine hydrolase (adenosine-forming)
MQVVTLTTEWKPDDIYNGIIKGKLSSMCPGTVIIDNACNIPAFNISLASFVIRNTFTNYPKGSVHIICIHSEAHKDQDHLIVYARDHFFIGTDNGIFNLILNSEPDEVVVIDPDGSSDELDIFAKAAAGIISGKKLNEIGKPVKTIMERIPLRATIDKDEITGSIIFIDSYGNAISNITREVFYRVFENRDFRIIVRSNRYNTDHISLKYSDVPVSKLLVRFNRLDLLEIAINGTSVTELYSLEVGTPVRIELLNKTVQPNHLF